MDPDRQDVGRSINQTQGRLDQPHNSLEDGDLEEAGIKTRVLGIKTRVLQRKRRGESALNNSLATQQLPGHSKTPWPFNKSLAHMTNRPNLANKQNSPIYPYIQHA